MNELDLEALALDESELKTIAGGGGNRCEEYTERN